MKPIQVIIAATFLLVLVLPAPAQITYTEIDYPGSVGTGVTGINNMGVMVGEYQLTVGGPNFGFTLDQGNFTSFQYPGGVFTYPNGINDLGQIVGDTCTTKCGFPYVFGFLYDGQTFSEVKFNGSLGTEANGINSAGQIAIRADAVYHRAFERALEYSGGVFTRLKVPGRSEDDDAQGINNLGEIVGGEYHKNGWQSWAETNGQFVLLNIGTESVAFGVNDNGTIVGWYYNGGVESGFVWSNGSIIPLNYPGAGCTVATGINNSGQVVGYYEPGLCTTSENHGFVTSAITEADFEREGVTKPFDSTDVAH